MFEDLKKILDEQLHLNGMEITKESRIKEDLGADSANLMMLIMDLETEFDITVSDEVLGQIKTVGNIVDYLEEHV